MKLLSTGDIPQDDVVQTFRYGSAGAIASFVISLAVPASAVVVAFGTSLPRWGYLLGAPLILLYALICWALIGGTWHSVRAGLGPTNWVMKATRDGLYLQFRSYLNYHFPETGPTAAYVPFDEIHSARKTIERIKTIGDHRGENSCRLKRYLELCLSHTNTAPLGQAVAEETDREAPKRGISRAKFHHVPVLVPEAGIIRVEWRGRRMLNALSPSVEIAPTRRVGYGYDDDKGLEARIIEMVERGLRLEAIKLVRCRYRMPLAAAEDFVDGLAGNLAASSAQQAQ